MMKLAAWLLKIVMAVLDTAISPRVARVDSRVTPANDEIARNHASGTR
jgi:hypothetical protein